MSDLADRIAVLDKPTFAAVWLAVFPAGIGPRIEQNEYALETAKLQITVGAERLAHGGEQR